MISPFLISHDDQDAWAVNLGSEKQIHSTLEFFGVLEKPVLLIIGGAGGMTNKDLKKIDPAVTAILETAQKKHAVVVDGGTDSGVMAALGRKRFELKLPIPLIGIAARETVFYPGKRAEIRDAAPLEPYHTHFILVPGRNWGDESAWIDSIVGRISGKCVAVVINGGTIAKRDYEMGLISNRPTIVLAGSGRFADELAAQKELPPHVYLISLGDVARLKQKIGKFL